MSTILSGSLSTWLLGSLLAVALLMLTLTVQALREARTAPYFFLRRQAEQRMQSYSLATLGLFIAAVGALAYVWNPPVNTTPLYANLTNAKPAEIVVENPVRTVANLAQPVAAQARFAAEAPQAEAPGSPDVAAVAGVEATVNQLPEMFAQVVPEVSMQSNTAIRGLTFAPEIDDQYTPIGVRSVYGAGYYTVYAVFEYDGMADGMAWSWVWRYNGTVVGGGNELWQYGADGPGYIYFSPEEGFEPGTYSLAVFVNNEMVAEASMTVAAGAANN